MCVCACVCVCVCVSEEGVVRAWLDRGHAGRRQMSGVVTGEDDRLQSGERRAAEPINRANLWLRTVEKLVFDVWKFTTDSHHPSPCRGLYFSTLSSRLPPRLTALTRQDWCSTVCDADVASEEELSGNTVN